MKNAKQTKKQTNKYTQRDLLVPVNTHIKFFFEGLGIVYLVCYRRKRKGERGGTHINVTHFGIIFHNS